MSWRLVESLKTLRKQLDELFPNRSKVSDGSIGDTSHSARKSEHNPDSQGRVCAIDITFDNDPSDGVGVDCNWLADVLVANKDPRIKYIIWNKEICSSKQSPWQWRSYHGKNPHNHHLHISVIGDVDSTKPWNLSDKGFVTNTGTYVVKSGDTLSGIAKSQETTVENLKSKNDLKSDLIKVGQILQI